MKIMYLFFLFSLVYSCKCKEESEKSLKAEEKNNTYELMHDFKPENIPAISDTRKFKVLTLKNKLNVFIISSPHFEKSAASMDVGVGSFEDPAQLQGLAHLVEHMLFLGTADFPDVGEYKAFLAKNQGEGNAHTSFTNTNFHFEVNPKAFEGALKRFSQFFISPLFSDDSIHKEKNAVNSEHEQNKLLDDSRVLQVLRSTMKKDHPITKFMTGNLETLDKAERVDVIDFYQKYYSANNMNLVLMSNHSPETMEKWANTLFSNVLNHQKAKLTYSSKLYDEANLPLFIQTKSLKDTYALKLIFTTENLDPLWKSKPHEIMTYLLGHEGEGSLLAKLKKENLATALNAGHTNYPFAGRFTFHITLSEDGYKNVDKVIKYFFSYMTMLKSNHYDNYIFNEIQTIKNYDFRFKEFPSSQSIASYYAERMHAYPALEIDKRDNLIFEKNDLEFKKLLEAINPRKMVAQLISQDISPKKMFSNQIVTPVKDPYFGVEYTTQKITSEFIFSLESQVIPDDLKVPSQNKYISSQVALVPRHKNMDIHRIKNEKKTIAWFEQDQKFNLPKGFIKLIIKSPLFVNSPLDKAKTMLFSLVLKESLNSWIYEMSLAHIDLDIKFENKGLVVDLSGYSTKLPQIIREFGEKINHLTIEKELFSTLREKFKKELKNKTFKPPYQQGIEELLPFMMQDYIAESRIFDVEKNIDLLSNLELSDIREWGREIFKTVSLDSLSYGNLEEDVIRVSINDFISSISEKIVDRLEFEKEIKIPDNTKYAAIKSSSSNNSAFISYVQFGPRSLELNAMMRLASSFISPLFYTYMRTKKQLGYVVQSAPSYRRNSSGMLFILQSAVKDPFELGLETHAWFKTLESQLASLTDHDFEVAKNAIIEKLQEKEETMSERFKVLFFETLFLPSLIGYRKDLAQEVSKISKSEFLKSMGTIFREEDNNDGDQKTLKRRSSISIYMTQKNKEYKASEALKKMHEVEIQNVEKFQEQSSVF